MKKHIFICILVPFNFVLAGTGISLGGNSSSSRPSIGDISGGKTIGGPIGFADIIKKSGYGKVLAVELGTNEDGIVKFQTAIPEELLKAQTKYVPASNKLITGALFIGSADTVAPDEPMLVKAAARKYKIQTWQAPESKVNAIPELQNALEVSRELRNWQQLMVK
jgi:hypothetical protein